MPLLEERIADDRVGRRPIAVRQEAHGLFDSLGSLRHALPFGIVSKATDHLGDQAWKGHLAEVERSPR